MTPRMRADGVAARAIRWVGAGLLGAAATLPAQAQFALAVSPPRFELEAAPGSLVRDVVEFTHAGAQPGSYRIRTADWQLAPDGSVVFSDALQPGSCRPWVAIERRELQLAPRRPYRFRFEVAPPPGTPPAECRFALMIEGRDETGVPGAPLSFSGRIAVIVYLAVGEVAPALELVGTGIRQVDGQALPFLRLRNLGTAHGRLAGFLGGTDAAGTRLDFQPGAEAILPGETREIALQPARPGDADAAVTVAFPITIRGKVEWGRSGSTAIDQRFAR
jgi:hypothetical protein